MSRASFHYDDAPKPKKDKKHSKSTEEKSEDKKEE